MNTYKKHMLLLSITCLNTIFTIVGMDTPDFEQQQPASNITMALRIGKKIKHKISLDYSSFIFDDSQDKDIKITESNMHPNLTNQSENFVGKYLRPSAYQKCLEDVLSSALKTCNRYGAQKCRLIHFTYTSNLAVLNNDGQHKLQLGAYLSILQKNRFSNISDIDFNCLRGNESPEIMKVIADLSQKKYKGINVDFSRQDDDIPTNDDPEKLTAILCPMKEILSAEDALDVLRTELPDEEENTLQAVKLANMNQNTQLTNLAEKVKKEKQKLLPLIEKYLESKCYKDLSDKIFTGIEIMIADAQNKRNNERFLAYDTEDIILIQNKFDELLISTLEKLTFALQMQFNAIKDDNYDHFSRDLEDLKKNFNQYTNPQNYSQKIVEKAIYYSPIFTVIEKKISDKKQPQPKKDTSLQTYFQQIPLKTAAFSFVSLATLTTAGLYWLDKLPPSVADLLSSLWKNIPSMPSLSDLWNGNSALPETI